MASASDSNSLSSDKDNNQFLVLVEIKPKISYTTIRDFTGWANWNPQIKECLQITAILLMKQQSTQFSLVTPFPFLFVRTISQSLWLHFVWEMSKLWLFPFNEIYWSLSKKKKKASIFVIKYLHRRVPIELTEIHKSNDAFNLLFFIIKI